MARKLQIRRGAKADLPTLSQGEFGFCTDDGAEELHIGNGSKNIQIPTVNVYYGDMNALVSSGIYRVGTNTNLHSKLWYGQVLVMQGADSDTVSQLGVSYTDGSILARAGNKSGSSWTFTSWIEMFSSANPPDLSSLDVVAKSGDSMTGVLNLANTNDYVGLQKIRSVNDALFYFALGIGSDTTKGASGSLRLTKNGTSDVVGRIDAWENGDLTYKNASTGYIDIARIEVGSYTGSGTNGTSGPNSLTFGFAPKVVIMMGYKIKATGNLSMLYSGSAQYWMVYPSAMPTAYADKHGFASSGSSYGKVSTDGKTIYWYNTSSASAQCNSANYIYYYMAIG